MRNGYFQLICGATGTGLKVVAPKDGGSHVAVKEVMDYLTLHGVTYDTVSLGKGIQDAAASGQEEFLIMLNKEQNTRRHPMDYSVLWKLSYGLYAIGVMEGEKAQGCIVNTVFQITADGMVALSMSKANHTHDLIKDAGRFSVSICTEETPKLTIGKLGFQPVQLSLLGDKGRIQLSEAFFLKELTFLKSGQTFFNIPHGSYPPVA